MTGIYRALSFSVSSRYINQTITLLSVVVVARWLTPAELGVFTIASAISLVIAEVKSFGVGTYLIRAPQVDKAMVQRALTTYAIVSWTGGGLILFSSTFIDEFYDVPDLSVLLAWLSVGFFLAPYIGVSKALMSRELNFHHQFIIDISSQLVQLGAVMFFIDQGHSYFSLAYANAIGQVVECGLSVLFRPKLFSFRMRTNNLGEIFSLGSYLTAATIIQRLRSSLPELMIGKFKTPADVAYFSRAFGFLSFVSMSISSGVRPVVGPYLSANRDVESDFNEAYLKATALMSGILAPAMAVAGYGADVVIRFFFGDQWASSTVLVQILCFRGVIAAMYPFSTTMFAIGNLEKVLLIKEVSMFILAVSAFVLSSNESLAIISVVFCCIAGCDYVISTTLISRFRSIRLRDIFASQVPSLALAFFCVAGTVVTFSLVGKDLSNVYYEMALLATSGLIFWSAGAWMLHVPLRSEITFVTRKALSRR